MRIVLISNKILWALRGVCSAVVVIGILLRLRAVPPAIADVDGVNFARALSSFDPLHQSPHLPAYPVYVGATKLFAALASNEVWALVLPALILFPLGALLLYLGVRRAFGEAEALGAVAIASLVPFAILSGSWPGSDGFGFALLLAAIGLFHRRPLASGILFGLLLGARLSWWPLAISALILSGDQKAQRAASETSEDGCEGSARAGPEDRRRFALGCAAAIIAWVLALFAFAPPAALLHAALAFGGGHFGSWGLGTEINLIDRLVLTAVLLCLATALPRTLAIAVLPYALWIALGQNLEKARHLLPFLPVLGIAAGAMVARLPRHRAAVAAAGAAALLAFAVPAAFAQGRRTPPAAAIALALSRRSPDRLQVFAGESARVIEHLAPAVRVWRPASAEVLQREALAAHRRGAEVLIVSDAPGAPPSAALALTRWSAEEPR